MNLKKDVMLEKAFDALKKQALKEKELKNVKGGIVILGTGHGQTTGMWTP